MDSIKFQKDKEALVGQILNNYKDLESFIKINIEKINKDKRFKFILPFTCVMFGYSKDVAIISNNNCYTSVENLTRDLLETYVITNKMIEVFYTDFDNFIKALNLRNLYQENNVNKSIEGDNTFTNDEKIFEINKQAILIENILNIYFPNYVSQIDKKDLVNSTKSFVEKFSSLVKYKEYFQEITNMKQFVANTLNKMELYKSSENGCYKGSMVLYSSLSQHTHGNIRSIAQKTISNGQYVMGMPTKNYIPCLSLINNCTKDILNKLEELI